jgi:plasmid stabilization system protein ParE
MTCSRIELNQAQGGTIMPRGDKSKYTDKQKRKAEHIAEGYEDRGVSEGEAKRRAWATVNNESGGGKKSGSGRGKSESRTSGKKGGRIGGKTGGAASAARPASARSASAKKAAATRKRRSQSGAKSAKSE